MWAAGLLGCRATSEEHHGSSVRDLDGRAADHLAIGWTWTSFCQERHLLNKLCHRPQAWLALPAVVLPPACHRIVSVVTPIWSPAAVSGPAGDKSALKAGFSLPRLSRVVSGRVVTRSPLELALQLASIRGRLSWTCAGALILVDDHLHRLIFKLPQSPPGNKGSPARSRNKRE